MSAKSEKAIALHKEGFNCSQAVFAVFAEEHGLSHETALKLSSSFGGGFGRLGEVCGAACGMVMALGLIEGSTDAEVKLAHYKKVRDLMQNFSDANGSYICRDLLAAHGHHKCPDCIASAVEILEEYLNESKK